MDMLLPVGHALRIPVDVINVSSPGLTTCSGHILRFEDAVYHIELESSLTLQIGTRLVINLLESPRRRVTATVQATDGLHVEALEHRATPPDNRDYPRLAGGIRLRYRVAAEGEAGGWLAGDEAPGPWLEPDPLMNFSVTGLRFDDDKHCSDGDTLLCEFGVPEQTGAWRAIARVVRVLPLAEGAAATHSVAIQFVELPSGASDALTEYALRLQRAAL